VAGVSAVGEGFYDKLLHEKNAVIVFEDTRALLRNSEAALVTSGTATLESAMLGIPEVVCYKGGRLSYLIARQLIKIPFISLVNLIAGREVVKELIQDELNSVTLSRELRRILPGQDDRNVMLRDFTELNKLLGEELASQKTARLMINYLKN
jgi:lipid-A-disaccharide synthase